ncbi:uncharacterized protein LOC144476178 [Augochlora pura]
MKDRFKMLERLNFMPPIRKKITNTNLTFVESVEPMNDRQTPLYTRTVNVHSFCAQGSATVNQANMECFHRRRQAIDNQAAEGLQTNSTINVRFTWSCRQKSYSDV